MKKLLSVLCCFIVASCLHAALDTIPNLKKTQEIGKIFVHVYKNESIGLSSSSVLSKYDIKDFTVSQLDSFLVALNSDKLVDPFLILSAGLWQLDRADVHERLCSFISLDTLDYGARWGENRRPRFNENEWTARLALARLGYSYHINFMKDVFETMDILGNNTAGKLILYARYINRKEITNILLERALEDHLYAYIDTENHEFVDTTKYYLSAVIMAGLPFEVEEGKNYPKKRSSKITNEDIRQFKQWIINSKGEDLALKEDSLIVRNGHFLSYGISIRPNKQLREKRLASIQPTNRGTKDRPHINYKGACYFEGDTIYVSRHKKEDIWLMAWQGDGRVVGSDTEWQGVSGTEKASYAWLDYKLVPRRKARLVSFRATASDREAVRMAVYVMKRA